MRSSGGEVIRARERKARSAAALNNSNMSMRAARMLADRSFPKGRMASLISAYPPTGKRLYISYAGASPDPGRKPVNDRK